MFISFLFITGLSIGSFLNVLIDRWSAEESIGGRSHCDHCHAQLKALDLIPVVSYFLVGGRCRHCRRAISVWYPVVELITGFVFILPFVTKLPTHTFVSSLYGIDLLLYSYGRDAYLYFISWILTSAAYIVILIADIKYHIIPDQATILSIVAALPVVYVSWFLLKEPLASPFFGAIALTCTILFLHLITRGRGMGFGDVKFAFPMGLLLGVKDGLLALYIAFLLGGMVSLALLLMRKKGMKSTIAFGPFLIMGTSIVLFFQVPLHGLIHRFF